MLFRAVLIGMVLSFAFPLLASAIPRFSDCRLCHKYLDAKKKFHPPVRASCQACHAEPHAREQKYPMGLSKQGVELCYGCHRKKGDYEGRAVHQPVLRGECLSCHEVHSADVDKLLTTNVPALCFNCHEESRFKKRIAHPPSAQGACLVCHDAHRSDLPALLREQEENLCFKCHTKADFTTGNKVHSLAATKSPTPFCSSCHDPHSSEHPKLLGVTASGIKN